MNGLIILKAAWLHCMQTSAVSLNGVVLFTIWIFDSHPTVVAYTSFILCAEFERALNTEQGNGLGPVNGFSICDSLD